MKLNGWQRIGLIVSLPWALGWGVFEWKSHIDYANSYLSHMTTYICPQKAEFEAKVDKSRDKDALNWKCIDEAVKEADSITALTGKPLLKILGASFLPVLVGWLLAYLIIMTFRWVRVGFVAKPLLADSTTNVQTKMRDREEDAAPKAERL